LSTNLKLQNNTDVQWGLDKKKIGCFSSSIPNSGLVLPVFFPHTSP